jgi:hypothetical protein
VNTQINPLMSYQMKTHKLTLKKAMSESVLRLWAKAILIESGHLLPAKVNVSWPDGEITIAVD